MRACPAFVSVCALVWAVAAAACGGDDRPTFPDAGDPTAETCAVPAGTDVNFDVGAEPCVRLSSYRFFTGNGATQEPNDGVVPYDLTTALFSDYSSKHRFVWLPAGQSIPYDETETWEFPVGAVIVKTFSYLDDLGDPSSPERLIETRLLIHRASGWEGLVYQWNDEETEAFLNYGGDVVPVSWTHTDGATRELDYIVPNTNKCKNCHVQAGEMKPIGPKARYLNRDFNYAGGAANQLDQFATVGYLTGAPDPATAPRVPPFEDSGEPLDARARGYLEINCAHCHNPDGAAGYSGLDLRLSQLDPYSFGVCKPPVAAGLGSGGLQYAIVPGDPDHSILIFRMESTVPSVRMPETLHQMVHDEGAAVIREWIAAMPGTCM